MDLYNYIKSLDVNVFRGSNKNVLDRYYQAAKYFSADNIVRIGGDLSLYQKVDEVPNAVFVCPPSEIDTQSPPAAREEGALWWNTEEGILYVWYEDADSSQWFITVPQGGGAGEVPPGTTVDTTPPSPAVAGQLWWNSDQVENGGGRLYVYYENAWIDTSVPGGKGSYISEAEAKGLFLSKTEDDTATGAITFESNIEVTNEGTLKVSPTLSATQANYYGAQSRLLGNTGATNVNGYLASSTLSDNMGSADSAKGYVSNLKIVDGKEVYNFYAGSTAPNWLTGGLQTAMPTDAWHAGEGKEHSYFGITSEGGDLMGGLGHQGNHDCSILAGGYRRNNPNEWVSLGVNGKNTACSVQVGASNARIAFCVEDNKATGTSSGIAQRATVTTAGFASTNLFINVDADDPAAFQTTYSTDGEEDTNYIGQQIDLKAVILELQQAKANLEARVAALEGA